MNLDKHFPRYRDFDPLVPAWCVTPERPGGIHRFFDTSPFSPSGRYLAVFHLPFEDRLPAPGDAGHVAVVDLDTGAERIVAETRGWEPQMGANVNWGASDRDLFFNDVLPGEWRPCAWKLDPASGRRERMDGPVYHASPDGRWLIAANMTTMRRTQPGYGVVVPDALVTAHRGAVADDGFTLTDTATGATRLRFTIRDLLTRAEPPVRLDDPDTVEIYGFHAKFNPQGDRLMLSLRWYPAGDGPVFDAFAVHRGNVGFAWITTDLDGRAMHCAVGPDQWRKRGHHATWFPDGRRISMNLNLDGDGMRFVQVNEDGSELRRMLDGVTGSGHPTVHRDGRYLLTDAYTREPTAFGDGTVPLRWLDLASGTEQAAVRIHTKPDCAIPSLRVDPHPAWDRHARFVAFNGFVGGTRRVFVADFAPLLDA